MALNVHAADLRPLAQLLLDAKAVKRSGQRRGTKYHVGGGSAPKGAASGKKAAKATEREKKVARKVRKAKATKAAMTAAPEPSAA